MLVIPFWINEILRTFSWFIILAYQGPLNALLLWLGVIDKPVRWINGNGGVMIGMVYAYILFMLFPLYNAIESLDSNQIKAARDLGAPTWRIHWRVVIPHAKPGIAVSCIMIFMLNPAPFGVPAGLHLAVIGQSSFITAYVMLMVLARMQRFDRTLEEAALDLGASHAQVFRRILMPHLKPAVLAASVLAFLQSFENFDTTLFVRGTQTTLTVYIASKVRTGLTPAVNALGLILIVITVVCAVLYGLYRHREMRRVEAARAAELGSSPLGSLKVASASLRNGRARVVAAAPAGD
jgi:ABC-type spermidine/putrescine transport system permease subunit I